MGAWSYVKPRLETALRPQPGNDAVQVKTSRNGPVPHCICILDMGQHLDLRQAAPADGAAAPARQRCGDAPLGADQHRGG